MITKTEDLKISIQNKIPCIVSKINGGKILSEITLKFNERAITSIITTNACEQLNLMENDNVLALIKTNEISLSPND